jgi:hypothetical protein
MHHHENPSLLFGELFPDEMRGKKVVARGAPLPNISHQLSRTVKKNNIFAQFLAPTEPYIVWQRASEEGPVSFKFNFLNKIPTEISF